MMIRLWALWFAFSFLLSGCGYSLAIPGEGLPADVKTLYVAAVGGEEADPEVRDALARELRRLIRSRAYFRIVESESVADAVLRVRFVNFVTRPVAFDRYDEVLDYETTMRVDAVLESDRQGVIWRGKEIESTRAHGAVAGAVVTTSSAFQGGERMRLGDLREMSDAQLGESRQRHAYTSIAGDLANAIYARIMAGL